MRPVLLVLHKNDHSLGYYDFPNGEALRCVQLDPYPHEFALSPDGRSAYVCHFGVALAEDEGPGGHLVSVIDVNAARRRGTIDCRPDCRPHGIALDGKGRLYVLSEGSSRLLVAADPAARQFDARRPSGGEGSHWVTVTRDGRRAYISNMKSGTVTLVQPWGDAPRPLPVGIGHRPEGSVLDSREKQLFVACRESAEIAVVDTEENRLVNRIATPPGPVRLCWGDDGKLLVALYHGAGVAVVDPGSGESEAVIALPDKAVAISYDRQSGLAAVSLVSDELCLIAPGSQRVVGRIATRSGPDPSAVVRVPWD